MAGLVPAIHVLIAAKLLRRGCPRRRRAVRAYGEDRDGAMLYFIEQLLNGVQLGMLLFLLAAGLTLIFGIMDLVNLAHGSLYMLGAYFAATFAALTGSFVLGAVLALAATFVSGVALEVIAIRPLYGRSHLYPVRGTFGLLLFV